MSPRELTLTLLAADASDGDRVVAFERSASGEEHSTTHGVWRASVLELAARLASANIGAGARVALYDEDPLSFSIGLFALWTRGAVVVLPPNGQPGTFERLREAVDASVGCDIGLGARVTLHVDLEPSLAGASQPSSAGHALDREMLALELFTSGTTGEGKPTAKRLRHLDDEVRVLEETFGAGLSAVRVFATASHQHLYGLLFRVLWPLAAGRPFCRDRLLHAEELLPRLAAEGPSLLASVPAHLDRMRSASGFAQLGAPEAARCFVFSSGGPLAAATAHGWESVLGDAPTEVFGSTETGGVAYRRQRSPLGDDVAWTLFPGVGASLDEEGCLRVESSVVSEGRASGPLHAFRMGDRAEIDADGRFRLRGRADRVVKIGEKRVSLPDMESRLRTHDAVADAALVSVELGGQGRVGAVVVPSEAGARTLVERGRAALGRELSEHLARDFDRVLVPRAWRYVEALPEDAQGKTTTAGLLAEFEADAPGSSNLPDPPTAPPAEHSAGAGDRLREPVCLERGAGRDGDVEWLERSLFVSPDLDVLDGHFPGSPIVPGVAQLAWVVSAATELLGFDASAERIEALKFTSPLEPGVRVLLRVERRGANGANEESPVRVQFRISRLSGGAGEPAEVSSGRLYLVREGSRNPVAPPATRVRA